MKFIQIVCALYDRVKRYKKQINGLLILSVILFGVTTGIDYITKHNEAEKAVLQAEIDLLKAQVVEERLRTQLIYFVMIKQADSINVYKTRLINCQYMYLLDKQNK